MRKEVFTGEWMIDAKINSLLLLCDQGFHVGEDYKLGVTLCGHIRELVKMSDNIEQVKKAIMLKDIDELESRIIVEWALFVARKDGVVEAVNKLIR